MKYFFIILLLFLLSSCISVSHDLGSGYTLGYGTDDFDRIIFIKEASGGGKITFQEDSTTNSRYFKNDEGIITSYVSQVAFIKEFIIVDQKPLDSICECSEECLNLKYPPSNNRRSAKLCEKGIKNSNIHIYYIIDKKRNIIIGPILKEKLSIKLERLGIREKLDYKYHEY